MRVLALVFALYFTVLGCLPCFEAVPGAAHGPGVVVKATPAGEGAAHGCASWCSPLCQCHCCPGFAPPSASALVPLAEPAGAYAARRFLAWPTPAVCGRVSAAPWQPPQGA